MKNKIKSSFQFLQNIFSENLLPNLKRNEKQKQQIKIKMIALKKKLKEIENKNLYQTLSFLPYFLESKKKQPLKASGASFTTKGSIVMTDLNHNLNLLLKNNNIKTIQKLPSLKIPLNKDRNSAAFPFNINDDNLNHNLGNQAINYFYDKVNKIFQNGKVMKNSIAVNKNSKTGDISELTPINENYVNFFTRFVNYQNNKQLKFLYSISQLKYPVTKTFSKKFSDFNQQLKEKKKLSILYGFLPKKQLQKIYNKAYFLKGRTDNNIFFLLEKRLDIVLYRACFFNSIKNVRQFIAHKKILVNGKTITLANYTVNPGDIISIKKCDKNRVSYSIKNTVFSTKTNKNHKQSRFFVSNDIIQKLEDFLLISESNQKLKFYTILKNNINLLLSNNKFIYNKNLKEIENKSLLVLLCFLNYFKHKNYKEKENFFFYLKLKEKLTNINSASNLRVNRMKPLHLEISYKYLTIIFLYYPQKLQFPALLDLDKITTAIPLINKK